MPNKLSAGSLFSGGGGADIGMTAAGIEVLWGIEKDEEIAGVYRANLPGPVIVERVQDVDPQTLERVDILWASPVCKEFSVANTAGVEGDEERSQAEAISRFLRVLQPPAFILENVPKYRHSESFVAILAELARLYYNVDFGLHNSANFGVPQTRRRLILRALRTGPLPPLRSTHTSRAGGGLIDCLEPWNGWYAAIEDLIPTLPESRFAPWQLKRLPACLTDSLIDCTNSLRRSYAIGAFLVGQQYDSPNTNPDRCVDTRDMSEPAMSVTASLHSKGKRPCAVLLDPCQSNQDRGPITRDGEAPAMTVQSSQGAAKYRAVLVAVLVDGDGNRSRETTTLETEEPAMTIQAWHGRRPIQMPRALLVDSQQTMGTGRDGDVATRDAEDPALTVPASIAKGMPKALLVESKNANQERGDGLRQAEEPATTVVVDHKPSHMPRALLIGGSNTSDEQAGPEADEPSRCVAPNALHSKALAHGRVVSLTPRCLARFQTFPDSYELPTGKGANRIACTCIGNAVPPLFAQKIIESLGLG